MSAELDGAEHGTFYMSADKFSKLALEVWFAFLFMSYRMCGAF